MADFKIGDLVMPVGDEAIISHCWTSKDILKITDITYDYCEYQDKYEYKYQVDYTTPTYFPSDTFTVEFIDNNFILVTDAARILYGE